MIQETTNAKIKKHSQFKNAVFSCIYELFIIGSQVGLIIKRNQPFNIETYNPNSYYISTILCIIFIIATICLLVCIVRFAQHTEKDDELSKLHKYKAGCISHHITAILFAIVVFFVKDFSFAFTGDFIDGLSLPIIILMTCSFITNITFIILEKFQLD